MSAVTTDRLTGTSSAGPTVDRATGLSAAVAVKAPVKAISSTALTLSGEQSVNAVACVSGDRVLVNGQADATQNGIYVVSTGDWLRAPDFNDSTDAVKGTFVHVTDGADSGLYGLTTANAVDIGTDNITFVNILTLIGASSLLVGNNLSDVNDAFTSLRNLMENGTTIVSANPLVLTSAGGDFVDVSGNTGFSAVILAEGKSQWVRFTGTPTITVGASLIGNGNAANIVVAAGDIAQFRGYAAGVVRFVLYRLNGSTVVQASATARGDVELATDAEARAMASSHAVIASNLAALVPTQAEMEAGTALDRFVVVGRHQHHPSAAKAWAKFDGTGTPALTVSYNCSSITDNGTGDYTVNLATAFSSAEFCAYADCLSAGFANKDRDAEVSAVTAASIRILTGLIDGTTINFTAEDRDDLFFAAYGDQ